MRRQYILCILKGLLTFALTSLAAAPGVAAVQAAPADDPEASPLYARSMQKAFADMAARDHGIARVQESSNRPATGSGVVVLVEGTQWYQGAVNGRVGSLDVGPIRPAGYTTDISCTTPTMYCPTCQGYSSCAPSYCPAATCQQATCDYPTCIVYTCGPSLTCLISQPTCFVNYTCKVPTCDGSATCTGSATCQGTCTPASCPTSLSSVSVPQAGQIRVSFSSSAQLNYVLQYCTNLSASGWMQACSTNGTGGTVTLGHTNGAAISVYRLLIQSL